ncbi:hypothetical protein WJX82_003450 [Trebouxia sp. C0006]
MSVTQPVPSKEAFLVEFPGYVRNPQAVIQTLGGVDALTKAVSSDDSVLQLRFRPDDPCSHPLYGERQAAAGLLLKIARKVADPSQHSVTAEVLACVHTKFTFSGMADYQYLPVDSSLSRKASSTSAGPYGEETAPLLCVPPLFTKADVPLDYAFKNFRASERPASGKAKQASWILPYTAQEVPAHIQTGSHQDSLEMTAALERHLNLRPIWTQVSLHQQVLEVPQADLELQLQKLCYQFKEGPWKGAWIRRGHDPRKDPPSWQYQTLQYDLPPAWYEKLTAKHSNASAANTGTAAVANTATTGTAAAAAGPSSGQQASVPLATPQETADHSIHAICRFEVLPMSQSTCFQLCDLVHLELQELLQGCSHIAECNEQTGWLTKTSWDAIVNKVNELYGRVMQ